MSMVWRLSFCDQATTPRDAPSMIGLHPARLAVGSFCILALAASAASAQTPLRPPSVPLVVHDPYFSIWSPADRLTDSGTVHWTGKPHPLTSVLGVDGKSYRLMGTTPADAPALEQTGLVVLPTRTIYTFAGAGLDVTLTFMSPTLPDDLDVLSRPVTYITWTVKATDGKDHAVGLQFRAGAELAVNDPAEQAVTWQHVAVPGLDVVRVGSVAQPVLASRGDDHRIDWGHAYLAIAPGKGASAGFARPEQAPEAGVVAVKAPAMTATWDLGTVGAEAVERTALLAYDDEYSLQYFDTKLRPYWRRNGMDAPGLLTAAAKDQASLTTRCEAFDKALMADLEKVGGPDYARLASLAHRQSIGACKVAADAKGQPIMMSKENFSNGCIATVDLLYPQAPHLLLLSPALMKATVVPLLDYASSPRWKFPFAPHDLGTYPQATGQVYGGGERTEENQMPVEESANMILVLAALAKAEGNADFSKPYAPLLKRWAEYLADKGFDPENQLCTDDFAGHLAHNVNLSAKAIVGLGAYAELLKAFGDAEGATRYRTMAEGFVTRWVKEAADGDHFRLAFDRPGTWSQKYNIVWDRILGLNLFPAEVIRKELDYYRSKQNAYGLPLDNRADYTKLDWIVWTASLSGERSDLDALVGPIVKFLNETPTRVPMTDWYETKTGKQHGFQARSVVGGVFIPMLGDADLWKSWAARGANVSGPWAPLVLLKVGRTLAPSARDAKVTWAYTTEQPGRDWMSPDFDDSAWKHGPGGFGTEETPGAVIGTVWNTPSIWLRRTIDWPADVQGEVRLDLHHDEDAEVFLNGQPAAKLSGYSSSYGLTPIRVEALQALRPGRNVIAIHCRQTRGGQYIDAGIVEVVPAADDAKP
jgi:hypothetical protein